MSKTKLAFLVFALAFGVNIVPFLFSKKAYLIEEVKNIWLYELPPTAVPTDSYVAIELGPQNGVIGTLYHLMEKHDWKKEKGKRILTIDLKPGLTYSTGEAIPTEQWVKSRAWALPFIRLWNQDPLWTAYFSATMENTSATQVRFSWDERVPVFDGDAFVQKILSHPMTGVFHPSNLEAIGTPKDLQGKKLTKEWISSGPYRVRKWNPKEIVLISRDDFPVTMAKEFFRTLKYQSAPVKNPSCDFMQTRPGEEKGMDEHKVNPVDQTLHIFWICRSWKQEGSFCSSAENRDSFAKIMAGTESRSSQTLAGKKIRYRIPFGSDAFRNEIVEKINSDVKLLGGVTEEISYFFKPSTDADIELLFVVTDARISSETAAKMAVFSSRLQTTSAEIPPNLVGEVSKFPIQLLMKNMKGDAFSKVFLDPDLEEKKLPL